MKTTALRRQEAALRRWETDQENPYHPTYQQPDRVDPLTMDHLVEWLAWLEREMESWQLSPQ